MKYYLLKKLIEFLGGFNTINHIKRVENNTIQIEFNGRKSVYFDMTKGNATVFMKAEGEKRGKEFNAPFDVVLQKRLNNTKIVDVYLRDEDKILNIVAQSRSSYKEQTTILQFEFTGKNTNIILLDSQDIVLEALRHIDEWTSTRIVKVGHKLQKLEKPNFTYELKEIDDIEGYLHTVYQQRINSALENIKKQKIHQIEKQILKISKIVDSLEEITELEKKVELSNKEANEIIASLYEKKGYEKNQELKKANELFRDSKKAKAKAKNQHIEQINLKQKLDFYHRLVTIIQKTQTIDEVEFYFPKKDKNQIKTKKQNPYQTFLIDGFKIMLGRDERENIYLLENSKASDFWFHLQNSPSCHVIVSNSKKTLPEHITLEAGKICAKFSCESGGVYSVDYTQRRNVKIQSGANVLYNPYSTIVVKI